MLDGVPVNFGLWDTSGQEEYSLLRPLSYPQTDVFVLCFLTSSLTSFNNVKTLWYPELQTHAPGVPIILFGVKYPEVDSKIEAEGGSIISPEQGYALCAQINGYKYVECNQSSIQSINEAFLEACRCAVPYTIATPKSSVFSWLANSIKQQKDSGQDLAVSVYCITFT